MSYAKTTLMIFGLWLLPAAGRAQVPAVAPEDFSHVVGDWFRLEVSAAPKELAVEDPLILTVRIIAKQPAVEPPQRQKLRLFPDEIARDFYLEDLPDKDTATDRSWVLHYRLKPRRTDVGSVPALRLVYYYPARKRFQSALSEPIALTVKPRAVATSPPEVVKALRPPQSVYEIVTGPAVLDDAGASWLLDTWVLACLVVAPPVGCVIWYRRWRRNHPDALQELKLHRTRAAQQAMRDLKNAGASPQRLATVLTDYLRRRLELAGAEPTPREVEAHLRRVGVSKAARERVTDFLESCDAARFGGEDTAPQLADEGVLIVKALEAEPCLARIA